MLGTYLEHDQAFEKTGIMTMVHILVHFDTREELEENITLHWQHLSHRQNLNYEGVPFRCRRCHKVGHLFKDCPLLFPATPAATKGTQH